MGNNWVTFSFVTPKSPDASHLLPLSHQAIALNSYDPPLPQNISKEVSILKHLAKVDMINIDVENMIRRKLIKVTLNRTTILTPPLPSCNDEE